MLITRSNRKNLHFRLSQAILLVVLIAAYQCAEADPSELNDDTHLDASEHEEHNKVETGDKDQDHVVNEEREFHDDFKLPGVIEDETDDSSDDPIDMDAQREADESDYGPVYHSHRSKIVTIITRPGILAGIVGGSIVIIFTGLLLVMFTVYRMRKKVDSNCTLEECKKQSNDHGYRPCANK
jgi:hypothetical protein